MSEQSAFWLSASPTGFFARCASEERRMRESREAHLLSSGEILRPRNWRDEQDFAKPPKRQEAA